MRKRWPLNDEEREDFGIAQAAVLILLALLIGFSYSMAIRRYDQRKNYEEAEANAIGMFAPVFFPPHERRCVQS